MKCDFEALESLAGDELSPAEAARINEHARSCPECARELAWLTKEQQAFTARARVRQAEAAPPPFAAVLARSLQPESAAPPAAVVAPSFWSRSGWALGGISAAAAVLLLVVAIPASELSRATRVRPVIVPTQVAAADSLDAPFCAPEDDEDDDAIATLEHSFAACLVATPSS
jgi:anti-sigma factor RsiW